MRIDCDGCVLRRWEEGDAEALVRHANDRAIWRNLRDRFPHPYTPAAAERWIGFASQLEPALELAIAVDGEAVGGIGLTLHDDVERTSAEVGYWLGRAVQGRGIATRALIALTAHAFHRLPLTRIYALPFSRNAASVRVLEKAGYRREGLLRRSALKDGEILDQLLYAITDLDHRGRGVDSDSGRTISSREGDFHPPEPERRP